MILHGSDLIVSIDGNANMASKSCTLNVSAKSILKTSPTSGDWEEVLSGKKSWSLTTNNLVKAATMPPLVSTDDPCKFYFSNSSESGWAARGQWGNRTQYAFDAIGIESGIHLLEINPSLCRIEKTTVFDKDGMKNDTSLKHYLQGEASIGGYINENCMIAILPVGEFVLNTDVCNILSNLYHVVLPCLQFGSSPIVGDKIYDTSPIIIVGGRTGVLDYGYAVVNSISNELNFNLYDGKQVPTLDGIPGAIEMEGRLVNIRMTDDNGSTWLGQAIVTQFKVTGTKGNLMAGSFSFKGNGELQVDKKTYNVTPIMPDKIINRIIIDMNESDPSKMITGDVDGAIINSILSNFHRYLCKYQGSGEMSICQLDDNNSNLFYDGTPATLDGTEGDVYVSCQKLTPGTQSSYQGFFYSIIYLGNGKYMFSVTEATQYSGMRYWSETKFIAAFRSQATTSYNNNVAGEAGGSYYLRSIVADRNSLEDTVSNLNTAKARMNNNYFGFVGKEEHAIISLLYFMKYGNTNSQAMCGSGANEAMPTGATVNMGMQDSDSFNGSAITNLFGIENWWGGGIELMEGISYANGNITYGNGQTIAVSGSGNPVIQNMLIQDNPLLMLPQGAQPANTNYNSYFCNAVDFEDQEGQYAGTNIYRGKGGGVDGGISWLKLGADMTSGTRLCFRTQTIKVDRCPTSRFHDRMIENPSL